MTLNTLNSLNFFEIFKISPNLEIDIDDLEMRYLALQKFYHPDVIQKLFPSQIDAALQASSLINRAYHILGNEFLRMEYLLKILGVDEDEIAKVSMPQTFLMLSFDWRERLESLKLTSELKVFYDEIKSQEEHEIQNFKKAFSNQDKATLVHAFTKLKFIKRFLDEVVQRIENTDANPIV